MKRIFIVCLLVVLSGTVFASNFVVDAIDTGMQIATEAKKATDKDLSEERLSFSEIEDAVAALPSSSDFDDFYYANKKGVWGPALTDLFLGFGKGALLQERNRVALTENIIDTVALTVGVSVCLTAMVLDVLLLSIPGECFTDDDPFVPIMLATGAVTLGVLSVNHITGAIRCLVYGSKYNKSLKENIDLRVGYNSANNGVQFTGAVYLN